MGSSSSTPSFNIPSSAGIVHGKLSVKDFEVLGLIGKGASGEVRLVRKYENGNVYAMKIISKTKIASEKLKRNLKAERDLMTKVNNTFVIKLMFSFQDDENLYLVMEYAHGGDLMEILIRYEFLEETAIKFYIAEIVLAIQAIHEANYAHRDLKPDNILLDKKGHIKLTDFGLCKSVLEQDISISSPVESTTQPCYMASCFTSSQTNSVKTKSLNRKLMYSTVGSNDYMAPEVLEKTGYGFECDWWSLGVILYECIIGHPPFRGDSEFNTYLQILKWKDTLIFPSSSSISQDAIDLIRKLVCGVETRLKYPEIIKHPFFKGISWDSLHLQKPPIVPTVANEFDTSNFPEISLNKSKHTLPVGSPKNIKEYSFKRPRELSISVRLTSRHLDDSDYVDSDKEQI